MKKFSILYIFTIISFLMAPVTSHAVREARPLSVDKRLRVMTYDPNDVFKFTGFYGYESSIVFAPDEQVDSITMGDSVAWQIVPSANRIFLKPIEPDATTNMTVITDKRVYHFELHADNAVNINDPNIVFSIKFMYPEDSGSGSAIQQFAESDDNDLTQNKKLNYNYTISGPEIIAPVKIFDDGVVTYFEFKKGEQEWPSIFIVYDDMTEGIANYKVSGKYIIVERLSRKFTLRLGSIVGCVFNENMISKYKSTLKDKKLSSKNPENTVVKSSEEQKK